MPEALELAQRAAEGALKTLRGPDHPDTTRYGQLVQQLQALKGETESRLKRRVAQMDQRREAATIVIPKGL